MVTSYLNFIRIDSTTPEGHSQIELVPVSEIVEILILDRDTSSREAVVQIKTRNNRVYRAEAANLNAVVSAFNSAVQEDKTRYTIAQ